MNERSALAKHFQVLREVVLRPVNKAKVFRRAAFQCRLAEATSSTRNKRKRLDDDALAAGFDDLVPPRDGFPFRLSVCQIDYLKRGGQKKSFAKPRGFAENLHVPEMRPLRAVLSFGCEQMKRREGDLIWRRVVVSKNRLRLAKRPEPIKNPRFPSRN